MPRRKCSSSKAHAFSQKRAVISNKQNSKVVASPEPTVHSGEFRPHCRFQDPALTLNMWHIEAGSRSSITPQSREERCRVSGLFQEACWPSWWLDRGQRRYRGVPALFAGQLLQQFEMTAPSSGLTELLVFPNVNQKPF